MSKKYCSIGKIPKGKVRGSMTDCVKARQVRYYGLKKIDPTLIVSKLSSGPTEKELKDKFLSLRAKYDAKMRKYKSPLTGSMEKKALADEIKEAHKQMVEVKNLLDKVAKGEISKKVTITLDKARIKKMPKQKKSKGPKSPKPKAPKAPKTKGPRKNSRVKKRNPSEVSKQKKEASGNKRQLSKRSKRSKRKSRKNSK